LSVADQWSINRNEADHPRRPSISTTTQHGENFTTHSKYSRALKICRHFIPNISKEFTPVFVGLIDGCKSFLRNSALKFSENYLLTMNSQ